jgi:hypothetical protein
MSAGFWPAITRRQPTSLEGAQVHTIELSDEELRLLHAALHSYLDDFGHEEADLLRRVKALIARLPPSA